MRREVMLELKSCVASRPELSGQEAYLEVLANSVDRLRDEFHLDDISAALPTYASTRSVLQRHRAKIRPCLPRCLSEVNLTEPWTLNRDAEQFLIIILEQKD